MLPAQRLMVRIVGVTLLSLAALLAWQSRFFHVDPDLSRYPQRQLTYSTARFERIAHSRGSSTKQIVLIAPDGRYVMEEGVWRAHFDGPALAARLAGGGTVRIWVHPDYPRALRGIAGGAADVPPSWGLAYDQRNMRVGVWVDAILATTGIVLLVV